MNVMGQRLSELLRGEECSFINSSIDTDSALLLQLVKHTLVDKIL